MKRAREEVEKEEQQEQEEEQKLTAPMAMPLSPTRSLEPSETTMDDAINFVRSVQRAFDQEKYREFVNVVRRFYSIGLEGIVDHMKVLLRGHPDLKRDFNMFVPTEYELSLMDDDVDQQEEEPADSLQGKPAAPHRD